MLNTVHDTLEEISEKYRELYSKGSDDKYHLTGISGIKTQSDIDTLTQSLQAERQAHKETKEKLGKFGELKADEVLQKLDKFKELEVLAKGKEEFEAKLEELTEARITTRLAPVERQNDELKSKIAEYEETIGKYKVAANRNTVKESLNQAMDEAKVRPEARSNILLLSELLFDVNEQGQVVTKEAHGYQAGLTPDVFLQDAKSTNPFWWPESEGSGGRGGSAGAGGNNPWAKETFNMTEQGRYVKEHGMEKAKQLAKQAGVTL